MDDSKKIICLGFMVAGSLIIYGIMTAIKPKGDLKLKPGQKMEDAVGA